jgi:hypothetical protein
MIYGEWRSSVGWRVRWQKNAYVDCDTYFLRMNLFIADVGARNRVGNCRAVGGGNGRDAMVVVVGTKGKMHSRHTIADHARVRK